MVLASHSVASCVRLRLSLATKQLREKEILSKSDSFPGQGIRTQQRGLVIVPSLVSLFLEVIALANLLHLIGLAVFRVLIFATRTIVALIVSMMIVGSLVGVTVSVALMIVAVLVATMLLVA
jgi:hypothetical protein